MGGYERDNENRALLTVSLKRRVKLDILCVERVLYIWDEVAPDDKRPYEIIKATKDYLNGKMYEDSLWNFHNDFMGDLENLLSDIRFLNVLSVGFAAARTAVTALGDETLLIDYDDDLLDEDFDPYTWDASFHAASAYSNGETWGKCSSISKRKDFWTWYLDEAVPQAYNSYEDD